MTKFSFSKPFQVDRSSDTSNILVGTSKGLLKYSISNDEVNPKVDVFFMGFNVNVVYIDSLTRRWWAGVSHTHWGQKLHYSDDEGITWNEAKVPSFKGQTMPDGSVARMRQIWVISNAGGDNNGELWLGTDPGGLFKSNDNGESWNLNEGLWNHPSRKNKDQWFGAGSDNPFIHSILIDPRNSHHLYVGVSCAGIFESVDKGKSWEPCNKGLVATYLPNQKVEVGYDPHRILMPTSDPNIMWQQNHCGVFVSKNGGKLWQDVSVKGGVPYYGFALAIDNDKPERAWVIPVESDEKRIAPDMNLQVYYTDNFGASWKSDSDGLPQGNVFDIVLRQAFSRRNQLMGFGTTNGNLYFKDVKKNNWKLISSNLTKVNTISII